MKLHEKCYLKQRVLYSNSRLLSNIPLDNYYYMYKRVNVYSWITHHTTGHILLFLWHLGYMSRRQVFFRSLLFSDIRSYDSQLILFNLYKSKYKAFLETEVNKYTNVYLWYFQLPHESGI